MSKEEFKKTIEELVAKFDRNVDRYKDQSSSFNETQLRIEFIDPMFEALGWDMNNKAGTAEQYKEVIHEDKVYIEGKPKAPDYSFKFWGERKFFLEAKQPFVKIKTDYKPALQLRRYAWSAHLPVSILSDFEELAIYDTTIEPKATDKASVARLQYYKYTDYLDKWEEIYDLFAKESIQQGSFDKFIAKEKRGSQLVDKVFLKEIENWREWLAKDIAKHNSELTVEQLNFAVQKIIDRIIFLRIAEDRGIERYKSLENIIKSKNSYPELVRYFKTAHEKYNSGLFDFEEDTITPALKVSDKLLDKILEHLYYPNSPYEFSVLGVELLGSIYEQFLGKVIRLTAGHNAKVEEKPEVKKAGGVFYTPQYIVEYIVKNTVGELLKDKSIKQAEKIKVLDPACGSGSFLIGAYEFLLNWHLAEYEKLSDKEKEKLEKKGVIYKQVNKESTGESIESWQLTTNEKKRIMLNNIYGVDIDKQAVEVTKLSLALKMLENENQQSINKQMKLFAERILPDMSGNIKCGNSLVGSDFYDTFPIEDLDGEMIDKIKVFDWNSEFKEIMDKGGFDAIVGNPPYIRIQNLQEFSKESVQYIKGEYKTASKGSIDIYVAFIEKGLDILNKKGLLSYITPHKFFTAKMGEDIRKLIKQDKSLKRIINFGTNQVFENATTYTTVFVLSKSKNEEFDYLEFGLNEDFENLNNVIFDEIDVNSLADDSWVFNCKEVTSILEKLGNDSLQINDLAEKVFKGSSTGNDKKYLVSLIKDKGDVFTVENKDGENFDIERTILKPFINAEDIREFNIQFQEQYLIYPYDESANLLNKDFLEKNYPLAYSYLEGIKTDLRKRKIETDSSNYFKYSAARSLGHYDKPKLLIPDILVSPRFTIDAEGEIYHGPAIHSIILKEETELDLYHLLGVISSKVFWFFIANTSTALRGDAFRLTPMYIRPFPIKPLKGKKALYVEIKSLVEDLLEIKSKIESDLDPKVKNVLETQYSKKIEILNQLVYELYGLKQEEIDVIEGRNEVKAD